VNQFLHSFALKHKGKISGRVLDVGSYDVNGSLRAVFPITIGVDMREGPGVDQVCDVVHLITTFGAESFDCVCSADALEHMKDWKAGMENMWAVLKPGGVFFLTMANPKKGRHAYPDDYIRMPMDMFKSMFTGNQILDDFFGGPSMGVVVIKSTDTLNLTITPIPVP
jgi:SAM-dependent methyltransferase